MSNAYLQPNIFIQYSGDISIVTKSIELTLKDLHDVLQTVSKKLANKLSKDQLHLSNLNFPKKVIINIGLQSTMDYYIETNSPNLYGTTLIINYALNKVIDLLFQTDEYELISSPFEMECFES